MGLSVSVTSPYSNICSKARILPLENGTEWCFTLIGLTFACKYWTRFEVMASDKLTSLLSNGINYDGWAIKVVSRVV